MRSYRLTTLDNNFLKYVLFLATVDDGMKSKGSHGELVDIMCRVTFTLPLKIKKN